MAPLASRTCVGRAITRIRVAGRLQSVGVALLAAQGAGAEVAPLERRLDVVAGRPAVIAVAPTDAREAVGRGATAPQIRLEDGRSVPASLYRFEAGPTPASEQDALVRAWLGPAMRWSVWTAGETAPEEGAAAAWALLVDLPADASGKEIYFGSATVEVNWLASPDTLARLPMREMPRITDGLDRWIGALRSDPLEGWRASLLSERVSRSRDEVADEHIPAPQRHPALNALIRQEEDRWRAALGRLAEIDPALCAELTSALTEVIDFGAGRLAPAWAPADAETLRLRSELLDPRRGDDHLAHMVRLWLGARPGLTTWVIDDAGAADARGAPIVALGVAERQGRAEMAGLRLPGLGGPEEGRRTPLRPHGRIVMVRSIDAGLGPVEVEVVAGDRRARQLVLSGPVEVTPPGLVIGPLLRDWRMADWDSGTPSPAIGDGATGALLQRGVERNAWELYIECRTPTATLAEEAGTPLDRVRVWLGPTIGPSALLEVNSRGVMIDKLRPDEEPTHLRVQRETDRWSVVMPIPAEAIGPDGALRLALQRVDALGERSTWPRALFPWSETPGRIAVDLTTWREVGSRD